MKQVKVIHLTRFSSFPEFTDNYCEINFNALTWPTWKQQFLKLFIWRKVLFLWLPSVFIDTPFTEYLPLKLDFLPKSRADNSQWRYTILIFCLFYTVFFCLSPCDKCLYRIKNGLLFFPSFINLYHFWLLIFYLQTN